MGRKKKKKKDTVIKGVKYAFKYKQIMLRGETLEMFNYDRDDREIEESKLGYMIIKEHYKRCPPLGYFKDKSKD